MILERKIEELKLNNKYRSLQTSSGLDFSSNDYLGFGQTNKIFDDTIKNFKSEAYFPSSRLIRGESKLFASVEAEMASWVGSETSLYFSSGYLANLAVFSFLPEDTIIFSDEENHASLIDGVKLSKKEVIIFEHNNMDILKKSLEQNKKSPSCIVVESLYSMSGDFSPISELVLIAEKYNSFLIIDEAHATGVWGKKGAGLSHEFKEKQVNIISVHTASKALACSGAFICCDNVVKNLLINLAKSFIYTSATPPYILKFVESAIRLAKDADDLRKLFKKNINYATSKINRVSKNHNSQIIPIKIPGNKSVLEAAEKLKSNEIYIPAIRYPTVKKNNEQLRVSINALQISKDIDRLSVLLNSITEGVF